MLLYYKSITFIYYENKRSDGNGYEKQIKKEQRHQITKLC